MSTALDDDKLNPANTSTWDDEKGSPSHQAFYDRELSDIEKNNNLEELDNLEKSLSANDYTPEKAENGSLSDKISAFSKNVISESSGQLDAHGANNAGEMAKKLNKGPIGVLAGAVIAVVLTIAVFFLNPSLALNVLTNSITNTFDTSSIANRAWLYKILANKFHGNNDRKTDAACSSNPASTRCKRGTVTDDTVKKLQKNKSMKVTLANGDFGGRKRIAKIELLDSSGKVVGTARSQTEIRALLFRTDTGTKMRNILHRSINPSAAPKNDSRTSKLLKKLWNTDKSKTMKESDKKDKNERNKELRESFRESAQLPDSGGDDPTKRREAREKEAKKVGEKARAAGNKVLKKISNPAGVFCMAYYGVKAMMAVAALDYMTKTANFALAVFREADKAKAGEGTQNVINYIMDIFNYSENSPEYINGEKNRYYKTTGWDSQGIKYAVSGNALAQAQWSRRYVFGDNLGDISGAIKGIETAMGGAKNIYQACRTMNSVASCAVAGGPFGIGFCLLLGAPVISEVIGKIIAAVAAPIIAPVTAWIITRMSNNPVDDSIKGIDAGDVVAAGGGLVLTNMALNRGAKLMNKVGYQKFTMETQSIRQDMLADERYNAKDTPFDIYNQYSFLGSIAQSGYQMGIIGPGAGGFNMTTVAHIMSLPLKTVGMLTSRVSAADQSFGQPLHEPNDAQMSEDCPFLGDIGVASHVGCTGAASGYDRKSLDVEINDAIDFMENGEYVNETGEPTSTDGGKKYKNYLEYCVNGGQLIGMSAGDDSGGSFTNFITLGFSGEITVDWETKFNCAWGSDDPNKPREGKGSATTEELAMFSAFEGHGAMNDTLEDSYDPTDPNSGEQAEPSENTTEGDGETTGDFGWPIKDNKGTITSCYAPRWGSFHGALDISTGTGSSGLEIVAADGGTVSSVTHNSAPYSGFGETVVIQHSNGLFTRYSHMVDGSIKVKQGDKVTKGQGLGTEGMSGSSTGLHLDFGVSKKEPVSVPQESAENPMNHLAVPAGVANSAGCTKG